MIFAAAFFRSIYRVLFLKLHLSTMLSLRQKTFRWKIVQSSFFKDYFKSSYSDVLINTLGVSSKGRLKKKVIMEKERLLTRGYTYREIPRNGNMERSRAKVLWLLWYTPRWIYEHRRKFISTVVVVVIVGPTERVSCVVWPV